MTKLWNYLLIFLIDLSVNQLLVAGIPDCLAKREENFTCDVEVQCATGHCVQVDDLDHRCCVETHCSETGLISLSKLPGNHDHIWDLKWSDEHDIDQWYKKRMMIGKRQYDVACLIPKSFHTLTTAAKFSPAGTPRCRTSSDCEDDEFCGQASNQFFCPRRYGPCLDRSNNGSALTFCFKLPKLDEKLYVPRRKEIGIVPCNLQKKCDKEFRREIIKCIRTISNTFDVVGNKFVVFNGVCAVPPPSEKPEDDYNYFWIGLAISGGSILIMIVLICIMWFIKRRRRRANREAV